MARNKSYFQMEKFVLRMFGISFREHEGKAYNIFARILLFNVCLYPFLAAGDLFKHDFETTADVLTYEVPFFLGIMKAITVFLKREKIAKVLNKLDADLNLTNSTSRNDEEEQLMKKCVLIATVQTLFYWICTGLCYVFCVGYTLSKRIRSNDYHDWQFPYGTFTVLNITHSPNFEISWLYQCFATGCIAFYFSTIDVLSAAVLCHVCFHLKILQSKLRRIVENAYNKMDTVTKSNGSALMETVNCNDIGALNTEWKNLNASLKVELEYHLAIINVTKEVNESFSVQLLLVFLGTLGVLSFLVYKGSLIPLTDVRMVRSIGELSVMIFQVFIVCFWSEEMVFEGEKVGAAAYEASFVGTDVRFQKSLILIIRRSRMPIRLTAGFVDISLATFAWILRSTYSAYMVLRKHNLRDD